MNTIGLFWRDEARLSSLNYYLQWIGWGLVVAGAIVTAISLIIGRQVDRLNKAESAAREQKIIALESATRPKPIRDRIITQMNVISPQIIEALRDGITKGSGDLPLHVIADLQRLADEPGAAAYISVRQTGVMKITTIGQLNGVEFTLNPSLLKA